MNLTIVAATGRIGRHLVQQTLAAGHDLTLVVRDPTKLPRGLPVRTVACDLAVPDPALLTDAVAGADAVLSALGPVRSAPAGVATTGTRALAGALSTARTRRLVVVSAAPIGTIASPARPHPPKHDPGDGFWMRNLFNPVVTAVLRAHYADLAAMEDVLRGSDLDWTIARPPKLTDGPLTGTYVTALDRNVLGGWAMSRADVAHAMLHFLGEPKTIRHSVGMAAVSRGASRRPTSSVPGQR